MKRMLVVLLIGLGLLVGCVGATKEIPAPQGPPQPPPPGVKYIYPKESSTPSAPEPAPTPAANLPEHRSDIRLTISRDTVYYLVSGETTKEIFDSVEANGPDYGVVTKGRFASGLTEVEPSYKWEFLDYATYCELKSVDINVRLVVTLPKHTTPQALSDLQLSRWKDFADGVAVHEQNHVDIYIDRIEAFKKELESFPEKFLDCDSLESSLVLAWESEWILAEQEQDAFHLTEEQLSQHLRQPVQMQIDQNESDLGQLQYKLDSLSSEINALILNIDDIERSTLPYEARMDAIQDQYPDLVLPSVIFDEYEGLRAELERLINLQNEVVNHENDLVQQYNRTTEEFNRLTEQTNQLIDELTWLP